MRLGMRISPRDADGGTLLVALLIVCSLAFAPTARAANDPEFYGTNLQSIGVAPYAKWGLFFDQLAAGKMSVARFEVRWPQVEPQAPRGGVHTYDWGAVDAVIAPLAARGIRVAPLFRFTPSWVRTSANEFPSSHYADFGRLLAAYANRYGPQGSFWAERPLLPRLSAQTYEAWNEPNLDQYAWNGRADPAAYAALLKATRPFLKAAQPSAVLLGTLAWQTSGPGVYPDFVARLAEAGGMSQIDGVGYHPYAPDAQSTIDLVMRLRTILASAGYPGLPIYANEAGQPAALSGPGAQYAYAGRPSDSARAASVSFAGDALAASDCNVNQFLLYSISGTEREFEDGGEPIGEGFMGMLDKDDATPNMTGAALQRASRRWAARFDAGGPGAPAPLTLCSGTAAPPDSMLPIDITVTGAEAGCARLRATYDGNPLESAMLRLTGPGGTPLLAEARTDAFGGAQQCIPLTLRGQPFEVYAEIPRAGVSSVVVCDVPGVGCPADRSLTPPRGTRLSARGALGQPSAPPVVFSATVPSSRCTWKVTGWQRSFRAGRSVSRSRAVLRAVASCATAPVDRKLRFVLQTKAKGSKARRKFRVVWLQNGVQRDFTIRGRLRRGDKIVLLHQEEPAAHVPRLVAVVPFGSRPGAG